MKLKAICWCLLFLFGIGVAQASSYTVKPGDWLSKVCPSDWKGVAKRNALTNANLIYPGQVIELGDRCDPLLSDSIRSAQAQEVSMERKIENVADDNGPVPVIFPEETTVTSAPFHWAFVRRSRIGKLSPDPFLEKLGYAKECQEYFKRELAKGEHGMYTEFDLKNGDAIGTMMDAHGNAHVSTVVAWSPERWPKKKYRDVDKLRQYACRTEKTIEEGGVRYRTFEILNVPLVCNNYARPQDGRLKVEHVPVTVVPAVIPPPCPSPDGPCVRTGLTQDCAAPGCVLGNHPLDTCPARSASCASAMEMNSERPFSKKVIPPSEDDHQSSRWILRPNVDIEGGAGPPGLARQQEDAPLCSAHVLGSTAKDLADLCPFNRHICVGGRPICPNTDQ